MSNKIATTLEPLNIHEEIIDTYYVNGFNGTKAVLTLKPELTYFTAAALWQQIKNNKRNQSYIENKRARLKAQTDIANENILRELINWAYVDATDFINLSPEEIKDLPSDVKRCIQHIKHKKKSYYDPKIKEDVTEEYIEIKLIDKTKAVEMINKHIGFYSEDNRQKGSQVNIMQVLQDTNPEALNAIEMAMKSNKPK